MGLCLLFGNPALLHDGFQFLLFITIQNRILRRIFIRLQLISEHFQICQLFLLHHYLPFDLRQLLIIFQLFQLLVDLFQFVHGLGLRNMDPLCILYVSLHIQIVDSAVQTISFIIQLQFFFGFLIFYVVLKLLDQILLKYDQHFNIGKLLGGFIVNSLLLIAFRNRTLIAAFTGLRIQRI